MAIHSFHADLGASLEWHTKSDLLYSSWGISCAGGASVLYPSHTSHGVNKGEATSARTSASVCSRPLALLPSVSCSLGIAREKSIMDGKILVKTKFCSSNFFWCCINISEDTLKSVKAFAKMQNHWLTIVVKFFTFIATDREHVN